MCDSDAIIVQGSPQDKLAAFEQLRNSSGSTPVFAFFLSRTCPHCVVMRQLMDKYRARCIEGKMKIVVVDSQTGSSIFNAYKVTGVPHVFVFVKGKIVKEVVGVDDAAIADAFKLAGLKL